MEENQVSSENKEIETNQVVDAEEDSVFDMEKFVAKHKDLPKLDRRYAVNILDMMWEFDWQILSDIYFVDNLSADEIATKRIEYFDHIKKTISELRKRLDLEG
jgi:hypothetical protein